MNEIVCFLTYPATQWELELCVTLSTPPSDREAIVAGRTAYHPDNRVLRRLAASFCGGFG